MKAMFKMTLLVAVVSLSSVASALPKNEVETTYFSDKGHRHQVGLTRLDCSGHMTREGKTNSPYFVRQLTTCPNPVNKAP